MAKRTFNIKNPIFLHLDLSNFKTERCLNPNPHDAKKCSNYHFPSEKRRSQRTCYYQKSLCPNKEACSNEKCTCSHNFVEQIYHSESYKKKYCKDFIEKGNCKYEEFCAMAHSDHELKITPLHLIPIDKNFLLFLFKSEFCPFSKINHDRFKCVYAHNWQDFKRPFNEKIKPNVCKNWDKNKEILEYEQGCDRGFDCTSCHGWKELEYHLANFKKNPCKTAKNCDRKDVCSFSHGEEEFEVMYQQDEFFYPVAKNIDYGYMITSLYLGSIDVVVNTNEQAYNHFGEGSTNSFRRKPFNGGFHPDDKDEDDEFIQKKNEADDPSRIRFSEKLIVKNIQPSNSNQFSKNFISEKNIKAFSEKKITKNLPMKEVIDEHSLGFNKFNPFQNIPELEKRTKGDIEEINGESSSSREDDNM